MKADSTTFVLFGATGDLAQKKILPALDALYRAGALGPKGRVIAVSRRDWDDQGLFAFLEEHRVGLSDQFKKALSYARIDIDAGIGYEELEKRIGEGKGSAMYHSSLSPAHHGKVAEGLYRVGLLSRGVGKLLIEKPFGTNAETARELDRVLHAFLDESQIYRIDHYLGKDTVRAIMDLHESTSEFDSLISAESVARIKVAIMETKGIDGRGASYDGVGAFRDVGQNHLLETLAALAAEIGRGASGPRWQSARARAIERLEPPIETCDLSRRGQYEGYGSERGVAPGSDTETAFEVITTFTSGKLAGTEVVLEAGKMMQRAEAYAVVEFRDIEGLPRSMRFSIQPEQEIVIVGRDGAVDRYAVPPEGDAYESVIKAAIAGSEREFAGRDEIEALWGYADHVVACWDEVPLEAYSESKPFLVE